MVQQQQAVRSWGGAAAASAAQMSPAAGRSDGSAPDDRHSTSARAAEGARPDRPRREPVFLKQAAADSVTKRGCSTHRAHNEEGAPAAWTFYIWIFGEMSAPTPVSKKKKTKKTRVPYRYLQPV